MAGATQLLLTALVVLVVAAGSATGRPQSAANGTAPVYMEEECTRQGGLCMRSEECPEGLLSEVAGLCPDQRSLGVECCHGVSKLERRCHARGGVCRVSAECRSRALWLTEAKDCAKGETCCALALN